MVGIVAEPGTWAVQQWELGADDDGLVPVGGRTPPYDDMLAVWWQGRDWPEWVPEEMLRAA